jgi:oligoendopeptidase F
MLNADIKKLPRSFIPEDFKLTDWATLEPFFKELKERQINDAAGLEKWMQNLSSK